MGSKHRLSAELCGCPGVGDSTWLVLLEPSRIINQTRVIYQSTRLRRRCHAPEQGLTGCGVSCLAKQMGSERAQNSPVPVTGPPLAMVTWPAPHVVMCSPPHACLVTGPQTLPLDDSPWGTSVEGPEQRRDEASFTKMVAVRGRVAGRMASCGMVLTVDMGRQSCVLLWPWGALGLWSPRKRGDNVALRMALLALGTLAKVPSL